MRLRRHLRLRPQTVPALRSALPVDGSPSEHPIAELFARELVLPRERLDGAIDGVVLEDLLALGLVERTHDTYAPKARIDHVGTLLLASDLRCHRRSRDFVVGPGPASLLLARHVRPHRRGRLLDLGCGSGVQGMLLGGDRTEIVAVDINPRALAYTAFNAALNGRPRCRAGLGDFLDDLPDRRLDGRFQTVVANPPFVLARRAEVLYRDSPLPGDEVGARTVERAARALAPGGRGYVLCNWIDRDVGDWSRTPRAWTAATGHDAVAVRVASDRPAEYAVRWTRDLSPMARPAAIDGWTAALISEGASLIHTGVIAVARHQRNRRRPRFGAIDRSGVVTSWQDVEGPLQSLV